MANASHLSQRRLLLVASLLILLVAACGPAPLGTSWPAVMRVTRECGGQSTEGILVSFTDRIVIVNPATGKALDLLNQDCEPRPPDAEGKPRVWDFRPGNRGQQLYSLPLFLDPTTLLTMTYDHHFYRVDYTTARTEDGEGIPLQGRTGHAVSDLVADDARVYVGLGAKDLVALDRKTLDVLWTHPTEHGVWSKPLLADGKLYFASLDHFLYAADAATGESLWKLDLQGALTSTPVLANGRLYQGSFGRKFYQISLDGQILSEYTTDDWVWGSPAIVDGVLYGADLAGNVYALDIADGLKPIWKQKVAEGSIRGTPVVHGDVVLVAARDQKLYWLNRADGTPYRDPEGNVLIRELSSPILSDVLVIEPGATLDIPKPYVVVSTLSTAQILAAYTLDNGQAVWSYGFQ